VEQKYVGPSRWEFLREVKQHAGSRVVLGSGDLFTAKACIDMLNQTGVDGVTAARGAIGNPWIFAQARALAAGLPLRALAAGLPLPPPPSVREQRDVIAEHYRLSEELYGPQHCGRQMRKFGIKYSQLHPRAACTPVPPKFATRSWQSRGQGNGWTCSTRGTPMTFRAVIR